MKESCDSEAIEITRCPMRRCIVEMEKSAYGQVLRPILRQYSSKSAKTFQERTHG
jgi:hypothetical protein